MEKQNRGEIVKSVIERLKVSKTHLADLLNIHRTSLYKYFENEQLPVNTIIKIGSLIHYDFSVDIPEVRLYSNIVESTTTVGKPSDTLLANCITERDLWKTTAFRATETLSDFKELFYQLAFSAQSKGIDISDYMDKAKNIGSNRQ